jgi:hypothetical protein
MFRVVDGSATAAIMVDDFHIPEGAAPAALAANGASLAGHRWVMFLTHPAV